MFGWGEGRIVGAKLLDFGKVAGEFFLWYNVRKENRKGGGRLLVDLHIHTCFSDGTMTPEEVVAKGGTLGFGVLAAADHNSWQGWERFSAACRAAGIRGIRGMEVDCLYDGRDIHLLAYGFSPLPRLLVLAGESRRLLLKMSDDLVECLIPLWPEKELSVAQCQAWPFDPAAGGWQGIQYLLAKGVISSLPEGIALYEQHGCGYDRYPFPPVREVISAIHEAGGRAVLAHPCNWLDETRPEELLHHLDTLYQMGLDGIECHYPANSPQMTALCRDFCQRRGILITAGSDDHGAFGKNHHGVRYYMGAVKADEKDLVLGDLLI